MLFLGAILSFFFISDLSLRASPLDDFVSHHSAAALAHLFCSLLCLSFLPFSFFAVFFSFEARDNEISTLKHYMKQSIEEMRKFLTDLQAGKPSPRTVPKSPKP